MKDTINYLKTIREVTYSQGGVDCLTKAIEACEKQVAMKPVPLKYEPLILHGWEYGCPACEKAIGFNKYAVEYTDEDPFCPSCGQKLKWED